MLHVETSEPPQNDPMPIKALCEREFFTVNDATVSVRQVNETQWHVSVLGTPERIEALARMPTPAKLMSASVLRHQYACTSAHQAHCLALFVLECISDHGASLSAQERLQHALPALTEVHPLRKLRRL